MPFDSVDWTPKEPREKDIKLYFITLFFPSNVSSRWAMQQISKASQHCKTEKLNKIKALLNFHSE